MSWPSSPVADIDGARAWYERLLGRPADNHPMDSLAEWQVTETGWVQVFHDAARAGTALLNFAMDDLDKHVADLSARGLAPGAIETANKNVQLSTITDPDATGSPSSGTSESSTERPLRRGDYRGRSSVPAPTSHLAGPLHHCRGLNRPRPHRGC
jgi:hypothetical protein